MQTSRNTPPDRTPASCVVLLNTYAAVAPPAPAWRSDG